ncbi:MAG: hypothetical protein R3F60_31495 [bacterium]
MRVLKGIFPLLLLAACAEDEAPPRPTRPATPLPGGRRGRLGRRRRGPDGPRPLRPRRHRAAVQRRGGPGVAPGFDLDGLDSDGLDGTGCRHPDFEGPDGAPGIDNQLATLMPILRATEARAIDGLLQESVNGGSILFLVQLDGLDDWRDDDAVGLVLQSGAGRRPSSPPTASSRATRPSPSTPTRARTPPPPPWSTAP